MRLTPREMERLLLFTTAELARKHQENESYRVFAGAV